MKKINYDYINDYLRSLLPERKGLIKELEIYAEEYNIPIIEPEVAHLLKYIIKSYDIKSILEIGTAIGYSSIYMSEVSKDIEIITLEKDKNMFNMAQNNFYNNDYKNITLIEGDANEVLSKLDKKYDNYFDLIFIDAAKGQYINFFKKTIPLLKSGGIIVSDNVLFKGMVAKESLENKRYKTIIKRLREYLDYINKLDGYITTVLPIGDGVALTYKEDKDE